MNWYLQSGKDSDVAINTKIAFSRNVNGFKFNLDKKELTELEKKIESNLYQIGYDLKFLKLKDMDQVTKQCLVEKGLITKRFANNKDGSILINDDENICILVGGDDHLKIQVFSCGMELENLLNFAIEIDEKIENALGYCVSEKYGYLTAIPSNVGTGLKASVKLHLPALTETNNVEKVLRAVSGFGIEIRELQGDMYQISNTRTLGITENDIVQNIKIIAEKIIKQEREARKILTKSGVELEDIVYRNYGILSNCRKINYEETVNLLSIVKLGVDLGILKDLNDLQIQKLYLYTGEGNLQKYYGEQFDKVESDMKRAELIKEICKN